MTTTAAHHGHRHYVLPVLLLILLLGVGLYTWKRFAPTPLPPGIASGNSRLEATEVDLAVKTGGRLAAVLVREGDAVSAGQEVAKLDAEDVSEQVKAAAAQARQAGEEVRAAEAAARAARSQSQLALAQLRRTEQLTQQNFLSRDRLDQQQSVRDSAVAGEQAASQKVEAARAAQQAAVARTAALQVTQQDTTLKAPRDGRVLYRLAEPGEVLPAGGKVLTLLDLGEVTFSLYLPEREAGKVAIGGPARIVLDALPQQPIPATVVFVSPKAQFTPKEVETRNEREKLMFRVKLRVADDWLRQHGPLAKPGMPGVGYVQTDAAAVWPAFLQTAQ